MGEKEDYLTSYRVFFENFAATVNPDDQLPVQIAGYTITESELPGEVLYWITQYLNEKQCPTTLLTPLLRIILDEVRIASKKQPNDFGYNSDESVYIALRLMQAVTARVNDICLRYLDNSKLDTLPPPPPLAQRDLKTVSCATKNSRRVMEDRHVEIGNLDALFGIESTEPTSFYAVYDGHAGSAAATYCAAHLHQYLVDSPHYTSDLRRAMRDAYLRTDAEFIRKSNQERAHGGSTAVTVCVRGRALLAGWAGDSLALLAKRMRLMQLVRPHKPHRQDERDRIESSGGTVMYWGTWRVNGQLAVSRAIGDAQYKPYVTARPEIATVELDGDEDFVVVACDGLWDFVSEDDVALAVYRQLAADPDDLKAVTKRLTLQAKRQGSADNISIIVVFLKDPRAIVADNCPPMDLGLDNAMMNAPPFTIEAEACKRQVDVAAAVDAVVDCAEAGDNGVDNSDSDSEDLGPETAVDTDDIEAEPKSQEPERITTPARAVEESHVDGVLDNVAESGEDSEDEWNYFKGEGEREEQNPSEEPEEPPNSETPCQDNSAWESSSVDMNSSPLNPDAPVFVPGSVGSDMLLAESPRKPLPMDDIELPDVAQFETEAVVRPAELLDLDNCDQLNGHHNISLDEAKTEHLNGNDKCTMDSLGFGFNVGIEPEKVKDTGLIQDFERIQKDTTDFCNIQVFQSHTETNPFAVEGNDELFERLKNKERDPMSMSFYQEKDDDTCERLSRNERHIDLNAVQPLPDSDDEDLHMNGGSEHDGDKENIQPEQDLYGLHSDVHEPNNDIVRFDDKPTVISNNTDPFGQTDNIVDYNDTNSNNIENYSNFEFESSNLEETVLQTDTPESHKLLFEQIPEIPDGKSSELGFTNDDMLDPSESEKEIRAFTPQDESSQDVEKEVTQEDLPMDSQVDQIEDDVEPTKVASPEPVQVISPEPVEIASPEPEIHQAFSLERLSVTPGLDKPITPEPTENETVDNESIQVTQSHIEVASSLCESEVIETQDITETLVSSEADIHELPTVNLDTEHLSDAFEQREPADASLPSTPLPVESLIPSKSPLPTESPLPSESPMPNEISIPVEDILSTQSPLPVQESEGAVDELIPRESPLPQEDVCRLQSPEQLDNLDRLESPMSVHESNNLASPLPDSIPRASSIAESHPRESPIPQSLPTESPMPESLPRESPTPEALLRESPMPESLPRESPVPESLPRESPMPESLPRESPMPETLLRESPMPETLLRESPKPESLLRESPLPESLPRESPMPELLVPKSPAPQSERHESPLPELELRGSPTPEPIQRDSPLPTTPGLPQDTVPAESPILREEAAPLAEEPIVRESPLPTSPLLVEAESPRPESIEVPIPTSVDAPSPPAGESAPSPAPSPREPVTDLDLVERASPAPAPDLVRDQPPDTCAPLLAGAALATAATVAAVSVAKSATPAKRTAPTPPGKASPRPPAKTATTPRTPSTPAPAKRPSSATSVPRAPAGSKPPTPASRAPPASRLPSSATKSPAPQKPAPITKATATSAAAKPTTASRLATTTTRPPITKAGAAAAAAAKLSAAAAKPSAPITKPSAPRSAPGPARPAPRAAAPARPATARPEPPKAAAPARTAPRPAPAAPRAVPRPAERKPLTNGDVKEVKPAARPAPRPAAPPRPAPARAAPRPATTLAAAKPAAPRAAPRAPLDKQSKDLANKRITAKAAPPRTAPPKSALQGVKKPVQKKPLEASLQNGTLDKAPPSAPADNALPDVIA